MPRQPLGRGLDAILGGPVEATPEPRADVGGSPPAPGAMSSAVPDGAMLVAIERVIPGRGQPRRHFQEDALDELAASIREQGIIQPLVVVKTAAGYELIAGERRLRAAGRAGLDKVPVVVRQESTEGEILELALVENLQREDLGALERARAYDRLGQVHGLTQEQIAKRIGKSRAAVANTLRLLALPQPVLEGLEQGLLTEGHARALLALEGAAAKIELMKVIVRKHLSVRDAEELIRQRVLGANQAGEGSSRKPKGRSNPLEDSLGRSLGTKVGIRGTAAKGRIEIAYYSKEELARLIERLGG
jgi:ParB family chromosome partitioning protein